MFNFQFSNVFEIQFFKSKKNINKIDTSNVVIPENITKVMQQLVKPVLQNEMDPQTMFDNLFWCDLLHYERSFTVPLADDKSEILKKFLQEKLEEVKLNLTTEHSNFKLNIISYKMSVKQTCSKKEWLKYQFNLYTKPVAILIISH